jgi:hypothetical protein
METAAREKEFELVEEPGKIPGILVYMDSKRYIVPALNLKALRKYDDKIKQVAQPGVSDTEKLDMICQIALAAVQRNYKDVTMDFLEEWIDMRNCWRVFGALMGQSGFKEEPAGEVKASA